MTRCRVMLSLLVAVAAGAVRAGEPPVAPAPAPAGLRVVDFNVLHDFPKFADLDARYERTLAALRRLDADVLILQEVWRTRAHGDLGLRLKEALGMHLVSAKANGALASIGFEEGEAILSKFPIRSSRVITLAPRASAFENRIALEAVLEVGARTVTVVGVHMSGKEGVGAKQATSLAKALTAPAGRLPANAALIVAGDFNAESDTPALRALTGLGLSDLVPGGIDHVLTMTGERAPWRVARAEWTLRAADFPDLVRMLPAAALPLAFSDHPGLLLDLVFTDAPPPPVAADEEF